MHTHLETLHQLYTSETQSFRKVHRMIDLFESIIKSHTVVVLGEYVKHSKLSDAAKGMLAQGLRTPSLGTWQLFSRVMFEELQADGFAWTFADFPAEFAALDKALNADKTNVIAFRNGYAHGATPTDAQCEADIQKFDPFLNTLLQSRWLTTTLLEPREGKVWVAGENAEVCVHPVLVHKADGVDMPYAFFNDLKNDKVGLLNYPLSKHYREKEFFKEFHEFLPLHEWKKTGNNEFYQRIEELTETFKGRTLEREKLLQFVRENHKGYCSIQGNPGIGKSALIAQFFKDLRAQKELTDVQVVEYFIRRGTIQAQTEYVFNYLIRRTDELFAPGKEIRAEGKAVWDLQQQLFAKWRLWGEQSAGKKLLFLIDGLDEGTENSVVTYMPRENFEGVLVIYGSRPGGHKSIEDMWTQLPTEHHTKLELAGLGREDIRALIYEVANKYEVERESAWIDAVQQRSQGNPLYLKLLCDSLEHGSIALNDIRALPDKIDEYYKAILDRYAADTVDGDSLLAGLFTFAAARDYLTMAHLGLINKLGDAAVQRIGSTLKEVLYENPLTEDVLDYQLFHESFREYLVKEKALKVKDAKERIIDFCGTWREHEGTWEQRYALQHYAAHAAASAREARATELLTLPGNSAYIETQKKVLKQFDATKELYRLCLLKASELKQYDRQLEAALCLVDLKYEEANDAPQVVALVAAADIDLALKRIESFGGTDEEGVKRRFTLYMLCLMELTLLESKIKPFRKAAIEKLLNHFDEQIPRDSSIINWNDFFPSYLMFLMACDWAELGLDYLMVYKRTDDWEKDWIFSKGPYNDLQFEVLLDSARDISNHKEKSNAIAAISSELAKQDKVDEVASAMQEALACARGISDESDKSSALQSIFGELAKQGKVDEAASAIQEALACARGISDERKKSFALWAISSELAKQGKADEALSCARGISDYSCKSSAFADISSLLAKQGKVGEALSCARGIDNENAKNDALADIAGELAKQGKVDEALSCARDITDDFWEISAIAAISSELARQGKVDQAFACAIVISVDFRKSFVLTAISSELANQGKVDEALSCARGISDYKQKSFALIAVSSELAKQSKVNVARLAIQEALACVISISDDSRKSNALMEISIELAKQGQVEEALACARGISHESDKRNALQSISSELAKQGKADEVTSAMQEALSCARGISIGRAKNRALASISSELAKQGEVDKALACAGDIIDYIEENSALKAITIEIAKQGELDQALACASVIRNDFVKSSALKDISNLLAKQGKVDEAASAIQEALACARGISEERTKSNAIAAISSELAKQGKVDEVASAMQEALASASVISDDFGKSSALKDITIELAKQGEVDKALAYATSIIDDFWKPRALKDICTELAIQQKIEEALACARGISNESDKSSALQSIFGELAKQGKVDEAASAIQEALACARGIGIDTAKSRALASISNELAKHGKVEEAASAMQEALTFARGVSDDFWKSNALKYNSTELAKQDNWALAETTGVEIPQLSERHGCWKTIAENSCKENGWQKALEQVSKFQTDEARLFFLKGWANAVNEHDADNTCIQEALSQLAHDAESIETLLQKHALYEVFFGDADREKINQLNRTLNIQWALDIAAQFPKPETAPRLSTNLDTWLQEIADEDDRDQIELWAKQVAKGKITEEEFGERVSV
jgi:acid stress-induced BolA-like protein IbaG/YrbA